MTSNLDSRVNVPSRSVAALSCQRIENALQPNTSILAVGQPKRWQGAILYGLRRLKSSVRPPSQQEVKPSMIYLLAGPELYELVRSKFADAQTTAETRIGRLLPGPDYYDQMLELSAYQPDVIIATISELHRAVKEGNMKLSDLRYLVVSHSESFFDATKFKGVSFRDCFCSNGWARKHWDVQVILLTAGPGGWSSQAWTNGRRFVDNDDVLYLEEGQGNPPARPDPRTSKPKPSIPIKSSPAPSTSGVESDTPQYTPVTNSSHSQSRPSRRSSGPHTSADAPRLSLSSEVDRLISDPEKIGVIPDSGSNGVLRSPNIPCTAIAPSVSSIPENGRVVEEGEVSDDGNSMMIEPAADEILPPGIDRRIGSTEQESPTNDSLQSIFRRIRIMRQLKSRGISWDEFQVVSEPGEPTEEDIALVHMGDAAPENPLSVEQLKEIEGKVQTLRDLHGNGFTWDEYQIVTRIRK